MTVQPANRGKSAGSSSDDTVPITFIDLFCVDVSEIVHAGLLRMLDSYVFRITAACDAAEGIALLKQDGPINVILLEMRRPNLEILEVVKEIRNVRPLVPILLFSAYDNPSFLVKASIAGVSGFVSKQRPGEELRAAIIDLANGSTAWSRIDLRRMNGLVAAQPSAAICDDEDDEVLLNSRERVILKMMVEGNTNKDIAQKLDLATETIKDYVRSILDKTGAIDRTQAALWAIASKIID